MLGFLSFGASIRRPFEIQMAKNAESGTYLSLEEREEQERLDQKTRDTDSDQLSDYDELYVFKTSPYIADTDSDGFDDKTEVYSGNNPNCPEGRACATLSGDAAGSNDSADDLVTTLSDSPFARDLTQYDFESEADVEAFVKSITVDEIRQALAQAGVPADQLAEIDDADLQVLFQQTLSEASDNGELSALIQQLQSAEASSGAQVPTEPTP